MDPLVILVLFASVVVGLSLGLLGGGGSILMVPLLSYVAGMEAKQAIATSLFVVAVTSLSGLLAHARAGNIRWGIGTVFGVSGMAGAFLGGLLGGRLPGTVLMTAFALMMLATAGAMLRGRRQVKGRVHAKRPVGRIVIDGLVVGLVTGLVGAGGGFLVVPALVLLGGLSMPLAVGTSLLVISVKSFAGLAGYLWTTAIDWPLALSVTAAAMVGSLAGARLASRIPEAALRRGFGYFVLVMGVVVLAQELPHPFGLPVLGIGLAVIAALVLCTTVPAVAARCRWRGNRAPTDPAAALD
ncbi:sulfite exporter TauE/SafE family protein [Glutamicibacter sp. MNS18]|uniref:sulfite exporter TauE/SafE family protein n=1 Tax=Glutamicibacter sp. MNS18 TaxID=2989817 RepID=UPI002235B945|nr:sulfite exporter TauE/SafE family protein [Glutamicibacter sp. MNS18]MCW4466065.1 sulfite exporter TauE/SafE family protein [Glutamicibacter sp. MNS18]